MLDENCPIEEVRKLFGNDRFATEACGCRVLEASRGHAVCAFDIAPIHLNAMGNVMGGAIFTLADFALAFDKANNWVKIAQFVELFLAGRITALSLFDAFSW